MKLPNLVQAWHNFKASLKGVFGFRTGVGMNLNVRVRKYNPEGKLVLNRLCKNITVNAGLEWIKGVISNNADAEAGVDFMEYVAVGTSSQAPAAGDTALIAEISTNGLTRAIGTYASGATGVCTVTKSFSVTGSSSVEEAGLLEDPTAGTLMARVLTGTVSVADGDTLEVEWTVTYTST